MAGIRLRLRFAASVLSLTAFAVLVVGVGSAASAATVAGWGENEFGVLGTGSTTGGPESCEKFPCSKTPVPVGAGLSNVVQISSSEDHTLVLLSDGTVRAWGFNEYGELGNDSIEESATPVPVHGLSNVVQVAAGTYSSIALLSNGTVMAWGDGEEGDLGDGATQGPLACRNFYFCSRVPVAVPGISDAVAIAAGDRSMFAVLADGTVLMWGRNFYALNGDGKGDQGPGCECVDSPRPVPGVSRAMAITASPDIAMALISDGTVMAWGRNGVGDLGNGTSKPFVYEGCECEVPVQVSGLSGANAIAAGKYVGAAILFGGTLRTWGYNGDGELGIGTSTGPDSCGGEGCSKVPVAVGGISGAEAIGAGEFHAVALLSDGTARAWGFNPYGQLGDGTIESKSAPVGVHVAGASGISVNYNTSFALLGPSQTLSVSLAGAGNGVVGGPTGILCPPSCSGRFTQGAFETLKPEALGSGFAGFSGACTGTGLCHLAMGANQDVTATFGPPKGTKITRAKVNSHKETAAFRFNAPGAITGFQCELIRPRPHRSHKRPGRRRMAQLKKQRRPSFGSCGASETYKHLRPGHYVFKVRALDILGADANPAMKRFLVKHLKPRRTAKR